MVPTPGVANSSAAHSAANIATVYCTNYKRTKRCSLVGQSNMKWIPDCAHSYSLVLETFNHISWERKSDYAAVLLTVFALAPKIKQLQRSSYQREDSLIKTRRVGHGSNVSTQINYSYTTNSTCSHHVLPWQHYTFAQTALWVAVTWLIADHVAFFPCVNYKGSSGILFQVWRHFAFLWAWSWFQL